MIGGGGGSVVGLVGGPGWDIDVVGPTVDGLLEGRGWVLFRREQEVGIGAGRWGIFDYVRRVKVGIDRVGSGARRGVKCGR